MSSLVTVCLVLTYLHKHHHMLDTYSQGNDEVYAYVRDQLF